MSIYRFASSSLALFLPLLMTSAALAEETTSGPTSIEDADLAARRARVERAEADLALRQREVGVANEQRRLDRAAEARAANEKRSREPDGDRFSRAGRIVLPRLAGYSLGTSALSGSGWDGIVSISTSSSAAGKTLQSTTRTAFTPSVDVFITDHWTVGGRARAGRTTQRFRSDQGEDLRMEFESAGYLLAVQPRVGRTFELGAVTIWPKLGVGYGVSRDEATGNLAAGRAIERTISAVLDLDVVFRLGRNVIFDIGPTLAYANTTGESNRTVDRGPLSRDDLAAGVQAHLGVTF